MGQREQGRYGLFTAITMITGTVIGTGIFFKASSVLKATGGSISKGVLMFALAALAIIFGSLAIGQLASRTDKPGGIMTYFEDFINPRIACSYGWFEVFIHYPAIIAVVAWVVGIYFCTLFNITSTVFGQCAIGTAWIFICFLFNTFSKKGGGYFQNASTVIKLIPLFVIAICGLIMGNPIEGLRSQPVQSVVGASLLTAIGPLVFAYDGWHVSTFVQHDIKNPKRNMALALTITPIIVTILYISYFIGISSLLGPAKVLELGSTHVATAAQMLVGPIGGKLIFVFVVISVMGAANGQIMGLCRTPYALSLRNMFPNAKKLSVVNKKYKMPVNSCVLSFIVSIGWMVLHFICQSTGILGGSDVSEIAIISSYLLYLPLYYAVFRLWRKGEIKNAWTGLIVPILATMGSVLALIGGLQCSLFIWYLLICFAMLSVAYIYYGKHKDDIHDVDESSIAG